MRKFLLTLAASLVLSGIACAQGVEVFDKNGKFGLRENGKVLVKAKYNSIKPLTSNSFIVNKSDRYGLITKQGSVIIPEIYDDLEFFSDNLYAVKVNGRYGLVDRFNQVVLPIDFLKFEAISEDLCQVRGEDNKLGLVSKYGIIVLPVAYESITPFTANTYVAEINGKYGILDSMGEFLLPVLYDGFSKSDNSDYYTLKRGDKIGVMDSSCRILVDAAYDKIEDCPLGMTLYQDDKIGFYTESGIVVEPVYSRIVYFQPEFKVVVVKQGDKIGFVTAEGLVVPAQFENFSRFSNKGIAFVERNGKLMAINIKGKEMILQEIMGAGNKPPL